MRNPIIRTLGWLAARASQRSDRGVITAEYLMWGAVAAAGIVVLGGLLFDDVLTGLVERIRDALP